MKNIRLPFVFLLSIPMLWVDLAFAGPGVVFFLPGETRVEIVESDFNRNLFKIIGCDGGGYCLINGHVAFGNDSEIPRAC
ncbi:hypothetical protein ACYT84_24510 [Ralstonia solanacearum]|uniref:hypothetical protein n=1 Tax=Ralstonia solanacearum TaxID=305 RepID=UPI0018D1E241|nr:hypothetical protein [Ralstonia solanacearum]